MHNYVHVHENVYEVANIYRKCCHIRVHVRTTEWIVPQAFKRFRLHPVIAAGTPCYRSGRTLLLLMHGHRFDSMLKLNQRKRLLIKA